jgi:hypothetical protein
MRPKACLSLCLIVASITVLSSAASNRALEGISNGTLTGNFTPSAEILADGKTLPSENLTVSGDGNITVSGNLTITDEQGREISIEELVLSGNLSLGCRRCHELNSTG